jgi:uncharacterized membrane protein YraQ (UPF0718 family)
MTIQYIIVGLIIAIATGIVIYKLIRSLTHPIIKCDGCAISGCGGCAVKEVHLKARKNK